MTFKMAVFQLIQKADEALDLVIRALKRHLGEEDGKAS